jgi:hypothetical protein
MTANGNQREKFHATWQSEFVAMLPEIDHKLRLAFGSLDPDTRDDAIEEGRVHSLLAYLRLHEQGRSEAATPSSLAWYSSRHVKRGRPAVGPMNGKEPLSRYAQIGHGIHVERQPGGWIDAIVSDNRANVADQVAVKLDFSAWFATLTGRMRHIATDLAYGWSTSDVARKYGVTSSRISQLRRTLEASWRVFQGEAGAPT